MEAEESSFFDPKVPHFFKVMLDEDIQTGKLIIPKKFVRKYGSHLSTFSVVLLKVPTGDNWEVELRVSEGAVRLEKGWPVFLNFYSIEHGDFLVFRYESGSSNELDVVLLNKTCTEVEYPKKSRLNVSLIKVENISEDDVTAEEARERQPPRRMTRRTAPLRTGTVPSRRMTRSKTRVRERSTNGIETGTVPSRLPSFRSSQSQEHPFFQVVVRKSSLSHGCMFIPLSFMRDHISLECKSVTTLKVGRRSWMVKLIVICPSKPKAFLSGGFTAFWKENSLEAGDTCRFELIHQAELVFNVSISRANIAA